MSTPSSDQPPSPEESGAGWSSSADSGRRFWLIPMATFVVGLLLGGVVIALVNIASDDDSAGAGSGDGTASAPATTPTSTGPESVTIPGDCIQIATDAQGLLDLADQAVQAARDLDADALSDVVAELKTQQEALSNQASICQDAAAAENSTSTP
jgi:hypothetical protein